MSISEALSYCARANNEMGESVRSDYLSTFAIQSSPTPSDIRSTISPYGSLSGIPSHVVN